MPQWGSSWWKPPAIILRIKEEDTMKATHYPKLAIMIRGFCFTWESFNHSFIIHLFKFSWQELKMISKSGWTPEVMRSLS